MLHVSARVSLEAVEQDLGPSDKGKEKVIKKPHKF